MPLSQACLEEEVVDHQTHYDEVLSRDVLPAEKLQRTLYCPCYGLMEEGEEEAQGVLKAGSVQAMVASHWEEVGGVLLCALK